MIRKTQFCGKTYHVLNIREFNVQHHLDIIFNIEPLDQLVHSMKRWCEAEMGEPGNYWTSPPYIHDRWIVNHNEIWFQDELDLFAFILRWT